MARIRPSSLCEDMQANLQITPEFSRHSRDPRMTEAYSPTHDGPPRRFPRYHQTDFAPLPDRPRPTQEQVHHFLYDHGINKEKMQSTLRYMGITQSAMMEFIRITYPCHYWSYIGNDE